MTSTEKPRIPEDSPTRADDGVEEGSLADYELSPGEDKAILRKIDKWYGMSLDDMDDG